MAPAWAAGLLLSAIFFASGSASVQGAGRRLLDITVDSTTTPFSITAFGTSSGTPNGQCYIQGYPGSRADSVVSGPLTVTVPAGSNLTVYFTKGDSTYFQNYNYSGATDQTSLQQNNSYGLSAATFSPTSAGQTVTVLSGLISGSNPITQPDCLVNITFIAGSPPSPPPPPPSPATPPPSPTSTGTACYGSIPCYCQNNYCFNNGATLTPYCRPPSSQTGCQVTTIAPSQIGVQYAYGYGSSVTVCKCSAATG